MNVQRQLQVLGKPAQLDQPIGLSLRRALAHRQATGEWKYFSQIHGFDADRGTGLGGHAYKPSMAEISPRALRDQKIIYGMGHHCFLNRVIFLR